MAMNQTPFEEKVMDCCITRKFLPLILALCMGCESKVQTNPPKPLGKESLNTQNAIDKEDVTANDKPSGNSAQRVRHGRIGTQGPPSKQELEKQQEMDRIIKI